MDEIAEQLAVDPIDLRLANLFPSLQDNYEDLE